MGSSSPTMATGYGGNQYGGRSSSQYFGEIYETPGMLAEGTMVRMRQELIRLPDVSKMIAEIKVNESRVRQVKAGMTAFIRVENIPDQRFKGIVRKVALLPDAQASWLTPDVKVFPTDILIEEELPSLRPGVSARAEIIITNLTKVLSVPIHTVTKLRGDYVCFVKRGSTVAPVPVTTGLFNDRFVEVSSGLKEGDLVLLAPMGDEAIEDAPAGDTNEVQTVTEEAQPAEAAPPAREETKARVRPAETTDGEAPSGERRRGPGGRGRRPQNAQEAPE
jgi:hypothetical protein